MHSDIESPPTAKQSEDTLLAFSDKFIAFIAVISKGFTIPGIYNLKQNNL
jgi:hypothetical protein